MAILLALVLLALAVRLPNHQLIPAFTDELVDVHRGLQIARGENVPLTAGASYLGSLWNWLLATTLWASGYSLHAPRVLALVLGVLTVPATYLLGRSWGGRVGGFLAAALLATAGAHVAVNSHVAWGNSATPVFTTLGVWALSEGARPTTLSRRAALLLAGLLWGLAVQTHPLALAFLPGAAIFLLWQGRPLLRSRWMLAAVAVFTLVNVNLLAFNLLSGFRSVTAGIEQSVHYTGDAGLTTGLYGERLGLLLLGLLRSLAGAVDARRSAADFLLDLGIWPVVLLSGAGATWGWMRGNRLPGLLVGSVVLILPVLNDKCQPILNGRYLAPLLPILYASLGALIVAALRSLRTRGGAVAGGAAALRFGQLSLGLLASFLVLHPLLYLEAYYRQERQRGRTNEAFFQTVEQVRAVRRPDEAVTVLRPRREFHMGDGGGLASHAFQVALALDDVPHTVEDHDSAGVADPDRRCREWLVIIASRDTKMKQDIVAKLALRELHHEPAGGPSAGTYGLYRLNPLPDTPASCADA